MSRAGFVEDKAAAGDLEAELSPVFETLMDAAPLTGVTAASLQAREALAMTTLFGRRVANRDITPSAAYLALDAFLLAVAECISPLDVDLRRALSSLFFEGYANAREERVLASERKQAADSQPVQLLQPGCVALVLSGQHEPEALADIVDRFGRSLLRLEARAAIVDITHLLQPDSARAAEVFAADASARMLGVTCIISGVTPPWREAALRARVPLDVMRIEPTFDRALVFALRAAGYRVAEGGGLLSRFFGGVVGRSGR